MNLRQLDQPVVDANGLANSRESGVGDLRDESDWPLAVPTEAPNRVPQKHLLAGASSNGWSNVNRRGIGEGHKRDTTVVAKSD